MRCWVNKKMIDYFIGMSNEGRTRSISIATFPYTVDDVEMEILPLTDFETKYFTKELVRKAIKSQYVSNLEVQSSEWTEEEKVAYAVCKEIEKRLLLK